MRAYLWTDLRTEVELLFFVPHPLEHSLGVPEDWRGCWSVWEPGRSKPAGRKMGKEKPRPSRARRAAEGLCRECDRPRDPKSKKHCVVHLETSRLQTAQRRERRKRCAAPVC